LKNKIGWCNLTFNPVWGCSKGCEYCYARKIAKRFWKTIAKKELRYWLDNGLPDYDYAAAGVPLFLKEFRPIMLFSHLHQKLPKKPQKIFVGSMSEIHYWEINWVMAVIQKAKEYPQHTFQFLTKFPDVYFEYTFPKNCWLGVTISEKPKYRKDQHMEEYYVFVRSNPGNIKFVCFEPLLERIDPSYYNNLKGIDWVIVGAETGNRKGKIIPEKSWVKDILWNCDSRGIPVYVKDNLIKLYPVFAGFKGVPNKK